MKSARKPKDGTRAALMITLLSFLTVYEFQKLRRLSTAFWYKNDGTVNKDTKLPILRQAPLVQTYLLSIGNMCSTHPH